MEKQTQRTDPRMGEARRERVRCMETVTQTRTSCVKQIAMGVC